MSSAQIKSETVMLYRPTGPSELALVETTGYKRWPPRLPDQPIFYPVTNEQYAIEIARDWKVQASGQGFVTRFQYGANSWIATPSIRSVAHTIPSGGFQLRNWRRSMITSSVSSKSSAGSVPTWSTKVLQRETPC